MLSLYCAFSAIVVLILVRTYQEYSWKNCKNKINLKGKVALITGANSGIGYEVAKALAQKGATVILACRNLEKANESIRNIRKVVKNDVELIAKCLDLSSLKSVKSFVEDLNKSVSKIDILINNAGVSYPPTEYKTTDDGYEIHFGTNHLGHFFLTNLLLPNLKTAAPSRVVILSSLLHEKGNIDLNNLNQTNKKGKNAFYSDSKLANAYFAKELALRWKTFQIHSYAVCPGWVYTGLFRHYSFKWYHIFVLPIAFVFMRTAKKGAQTVIYCATDPQVENETGLFYRNCAVYNSKANFDLNVSKELWTASEGMINSKIKLE